MDACCQATWEAQRECLDAMFENDLNGETGPAHVACKVAQRKLIVQFLVLTTLGR